MARRCPQSKFIGVGYLINWRWFICERGYANIMESRGDTVYGLVYELSQSDEMSLDGFEEVPNSYVKKYLTVTFLGDKEVATSKDIEMLVYIDVQRVCYGPPKTEYIRVMNMAIEDAAKEGIPKEYIEKDLRSFIPKQWANTHSTLYR
ncbi:hypothetical protein NP233_g2203 [Leucocoprinus birnbaumii]|uniref:gamma-glutamylcyclotransferase n=1 Tax=Leucocoprinus birnbaumii TaxID=56174 RepID=A0AAD5VZA1_9AGAR|nr:hypothetical protein NP233_g2203 [Leucocoprinus birnbaumii]